MVAPVNFSLKFGPFRLTHESLTQRDLTLAEIREDRFDLKAVFGGQLFPCPMDLRNDGIFPHGVTLP